MKKFMALYFAPTIAREQAMKDATPEQLRGEMKLWEEWMKKHADSIIDAGDPLGKTKEASRAGVRDIRNEIDGYTIVQAESHEAAMQLFGPEHPHFSVVGARVEVMEIVPMPVVE